MIRYVSYVNTRLVDHQSLQKNHQLSKKLPYNISTVVGTEENILFMSVMNVFDVGGGITEHSTAILIFGRPSDRQYDTRASLMTKHMRGRVFFCMYPKWLQLCTVLSNYTKNVLPLRQNSISWKQQQYFKTFVTTNFTYFYITLSTWKKNIANFDLVFR